MIDGKVCNAVVGNKSSQVCYICGASPKEINHIDVIKKRQVDYSTFAFGLSTLHAWIRFFECILHVAYRMDFKKWQARGKDRDLLKQRKKEIQERFRNGLGLLVERPKPGGSGTSNDWNTARRFFSNPELSSTITGVDKDLIKRFAVVLQVISSDRDIKADSFNQYALETAKLFIQKYPWFYLPASVHKVLIHGSQIIKSALLPIGQLSEEAQEARNKDIKRYREHHTRKSSRKNTMTDLINNLLISSDPLISSIRKSHKKQKTPLWNEALHLLKDSSEGGDEEESADNEENINDESTSDEDSDTE